MLETRSKSGENSFAASLVVDSKSTENRIQTLAAKLVDTRAELQSVSEELWNTGNADDEVDSILYTSCIFLCLYLVMRRVSTLGRILEVSFFPDFEYIDRIGCINLILSSGVFAQLFGRWTSSV